MKKSIWIKIMLALLAISMAFSLFACQGNVNPDGSGSGTEAPTEGGDTSGNENPPDDDTDTGTGTGTVTPPPVEDYEGVGDNLAEGSFALTEHEVDASAASDISASQVKSENLQAGKVYKVTGQVSISSDLDGKGAAIIAPDGVVINGSAEVKNVIIVGGVTVSAANVTLKSVDIQVGDLDALTVSAGAADLTVDDCRLTSKDSAVKAAATGTTVKNSYIDARIGIAVSGDSVSVIGNRINAKLDGVVSCAKDLAINYNTVKISSSGTGINLGAGSVNTLASYNNVEGSTSAISVTDSLNTALYFNLAYGVYANRNTNTYIIKNTFKGKLELVSNDYLICDGNGYVDNGSDHTPIVSGNDNVNGDNLMDVNERAEVGAKEELLPHTNKDLFVNMDKKATVRDAALGSTLALDAYIEKHAKNGGVVIVPPGYYTLGSGSANMISFSKTHDGAQVYAYGVFGEKEFNKTNNNNNRVLDFSGGVGDIAVYGLTLGYDHPSSGQIHILEKLGSNKILAVAGAGFPEGFKGSNPLLDSDITPDIIIDGQHISGSSVEKVVENSDGTLTVTLGSVSSTIYNAMDVGDVMYCRIKGANCHSINFGDIDNAKLKDFTFYGFTAGMAFVATEGSEGVKLERVHNTSRSAAVIDKATYDKYIAIQEQYGLSDLVYIDESGNYRGSVPMVGSVDSMHVVRADKGFTVTSSIFENMCDDGANHRGSTYRIYNYEVSGDKVIFTVVNYVREAQHNSNSGKTITLDNVADRFAAGDVAYIYSPEGKVIFKGEILSYVSDKVITDTSTAVTYKLSTCKMTVNKADVDMTVLSGCMFENMDYRGEVIVDNLSRNSDTSLFDNVLFQNTRSYGSRIKNNNATIKNCTYRDVAMSALIIGAEIRTWGESTMPENVQILDCLFDNTGFRGMHNSASYAPIIVEGLVDKNSTSGNGMVSITVEGCEFRGYSMSYLISLTGAKSATIKDNTLVNFTGNKFVNTKLSANVSESGTKNITVTDDGNDNPGEEKPPVEVSGTPVADFNKDLESLITDKAANELQFIHFADIHRRVETWNRIVDYYNDYSDYIDFAVHAGDYVGAYNSPENGNYNDMYSVGMESDKPVYNVVGNHDIYANAGGSKKHDKNGIISTLFTKTDDWDVNFMSGTAVNTSYYRDFPEQKVRFIVLDNYNSEAGQLGWFKGLLDEAKAMDYHVLTSMHEPTAAIVKPLDTSFHSLLAGTSGFRTSKFDEAIGDFIKEGGKFIANLTGHWHIDIMGYTANGVLNISIEIATANAVGSEQLDGRPQTPGVRGFDAFNVVNVNTETGIFEIVRIGNDVDSNRRQKTTLVFDYVNGDIISENGVAK